MLSSPALTNGSSQLGLCMSYESGHAEKGMSDVLTVVRWRVLHHGFSSEAECTNRRCRPTDHQRHLGKPIYTCPTGCNGRN